MTSGKRLPSAITVDTYCFVLVTAFAAPVVAFAILLLSQLQQDNDAALERRSGLGIGFALNKIFGDNNRTALNVTRALGGLTFLAGVGRRLTA